MVSCRSVSEVQVPAPIEITKTAETPVPYVITDYRDKARGGIMPGWVSAWLDSGIQGVEDLYPGNFVFIGRNEGNNFNALNLWKDGFQAELDFPRLASARIEERFHYAVLHPDEEYGAFYFALIRAVSDSLWLGTVRAGDFWISKRYLPGEDESGQTDEALRQNEREAWEFLVMVTIEKAVFASQLEAIFQNLNPNPPPTRDQAVAINSVKNSFYERF